MFSINISWFGSKFEVLLLQVSLWTSKMVNFLSPGSRDFFFKPFRKIAILTNKVHI